MEAYFLKRKSIRIALASLMFVMILFLVFFGPPSLAPLWAWLNGPASAGQNAAITGGGSLLLFP